MIKEELYTELAYGKRKQIIVLKQFLLTGNRIKIYNVNIYIKGIGEKKRNVKETKAAALIVYFSR